MDAVTYMLFTIPIYMFELFRVQIPYYGVFKESVKGVLTSYTPIMYSVLNKNIRHAIYGLFDCVVKVSPSR